VRSAAQARPRERAPRSVSDSHGEFGPLIGDKVSRCSRRRTPWESIRSLFIGISVWQGQRLPLESAIRKVFGAETLYVVNDIAPDRRRSATCRTVPWLKRDDARIARINPILGGTNEVLRRFIACPACRGPARRPDVVAEFHMREPISLGC
jgi:hypothetical protein